MAFLSASPHHKLPGREPKRPLAIPEKCKCRWHKVRSRAPQKIPLARMFQSKCLNATFSIVLTTFAFDVAFWTKAQSFYCTSWGPHSESDHSTVGLAIQKSSDLSLPPASC